MVLAGTIAYENGFKTFGFAFGRRYLESEIDIYWGPEKWLAQVNNAMLI
jgi:catalase (peroxidase I)